MSLVRCLAGIVLAVAALAGTQAFSQSKDGGCDAIRDAVLQYDLGQQFQQKAPISNDFLLGGKDTVGCLVGILGEMRLSVQSPQMEGKTREQLVLVTGALRSILTTLGTDAIRFYRGFDSPDATIALAFAARSDDPSLRINATLILADVIDDTTVCVPIDHLYDPALLKSEGGESGRINLIGVVSVAAPWAYLENFDNISRLAAKLRRDIEGQDNAAQAREVLANLEKRLKFQKAPNKFERLPDNMLDCAKYQPVWANAEEPNLTYPPPAGFDP